MYSICVQTFKDLAIPFSTLPYGDKNDYAQAKETSRLWLETAASTALAAGFFFIDFAVLKCSQYTFNRMTNIDTYLLKFIVNNGFLYIVPTIYFRFDSHATILCRLAENIYHAYENYKSENYYFFGINVLYAAKKLKPAENDNPHHHGGRWRRPIHDFAESWAPMVAAWYGYKEVRV